jgi:hypothetical protein
MFVLFTFYAKVIVFVMNLQYITNFLFFLLTYQTVITRSICKYKL